MEKSPPKPTDKKNKAFGPHLFSPHPEDSREALRQSEERFRLLVQAVKDYAIFMLDTEGYITSWNEGAERIKGYTAQEIIGRHFSCFYTPEDIARGKPSELLSIAKEKGRIEVEGLRVRKDGSRFWADVLITAVHDTKGELRGFAKVTRDITERIQAEESLKEKQNQINQLQKMEAMGRLAGGIAHDFNNLLSGILGCTEAIAPLIPEEDPGMQDIAEIEKACERGRLLIRQLMAFSRRQLATPKILNLNDVLKDMMTLLQRSVSSHFHIQFQLAPDLANIQMDISQVEQIIMNLTLNARDAMPAGGELLIRTENMFVDELIAIEGFPQRPCPAVVLTVRDTGTGMTQEVLDKIFEPFFTTKPQGKGTGLGLSTVYGIIQQNQGGICVYSFPNMGSTFKIFLPVPQEPGKPPAYSSDPVKDHPQWQGTELILVVEDDSLVLRNTVRALQKLGYTVLSANSAENALDIFTKARGRIQLLLTDIIMSGENGKELADRLLKQDPGLRVLYMSGYAAETIAQHGLIQGTISLIEKPFNKETLARKVRETLDRPAIS